MPEVDRAKFEKDIIDLVRSPDPEAILIAKIGLNNDQRIPKQTHPGPATWPELQTYVKNNINRLRKEHPKIGWQDLAAKFWPGEILRKSKDSWERFGQTIARLEDLRDEYVETGDINPMGYGPTYYRGSAFEAAQQSSGKTTYDLTSIMASGVALPQERTASCTAHAHKNTKPPPATTSASTKPQPDTKADEAYHRQTYHTGPAGTDPCPICLTDYSKILRDEEKGLTPSSRRIPAYSRVYHSSLPEDDEISAHRQFTCACFCEDIAIRLDYWDDELADHHPDAVRVSAPDLLSWREGQYRKLVQVKKKMLALRIKRNTERFLEVFDHWEKQVRPTFRASTSMAAVARPAPPYTVKSLKKTLANDIAVVKEAKSHADMPRRVYRATYVGTAVARGLWSRASVREKGSAEWTEQSREYCAGIGVDEELLLLRKLAGVQQVGSQSAEQAKLVASGKALVARVMGKK